MSDPDFFGMHDGGTLKQLEEKLVDDLHGLATRSNYLEDADALTYMRQLLKRQIVFISRVPDSKMYGMSEAEKKKFKRDEGGVEVFSQPDPNTNGGDAAEFAKLKYKDGPLVIYNSGGHYEPLIKK